MLKGFARHLDLQAKIILVLLAVIIPTFVLVTIAQNKMTRPLLEDEVRQVGEQAGGRLAAEIVSDRLLQLPKPTPAIEGRVQEILYQQPNILRIDVIAKDSLTGRPKVIASNIEEDPQESEVPPGEFELVEQTTSEYKADESGGSFWDLHIPIEQKSREPHAHARFLGTVHVVISNKLVGRFAKTLWKTTGAAAVFSMFALISGLGYFLRKTIQNDRKLRQAESSKPSAH